MTLVVPNSKEGWLEKKGAVNKNWRERWFSLHNGQLEYYVDKDVRLYRTEKSDNETGSPPHTDTPCCFAFAIAEIEEEGRDYDERDQGDWSSGT